MILKKMINFPFLTKIQNFSAIQQRFSYLTTIFRFTTFLQSFKFNDKNNLQILTYLRICRIFQDLVLIRATKNLSESHQKCFLWKFLKKGDNIEQ
jgi:hypothetical protein